MPPIRSLVSEHCACVISVIFLLGEIMLTYSHYAEKKLVYIIITAPFSHQPFSYIKCTKLNMYLSCNIRLVLSTKCVSSVYLIIL